MYLMSLNLIEINNNNNKIDQRWMRESEETKVEEERDGDKWNE